MEVSQPVAKCNRCQASLQPHLAGDGIKLCLACRSENSKVSEVFSSLVSDEISSMPEKEQCACCRRVFSATDHGIASQGRLICEQCVGWVLDNQKTTLKNIFDLRDDKWIVKSSSHIAGPYSKDRIKKGLMEREMVPLDEVMRPSGFWQFLRSEPLFADVFQELRNFTWSNREETATGTMATKTGDTIDATLTESISDGEGVKVATATHSSGGAKTSSAPLKRYGQDLGSQEKNALGRRLGWLWLLVVLAAAMVVGGLYQFKPQLFKQAEKNDMSFQDLLKAAYHTKSVGDNQQTIKYLEQALLLQPGDSDVNIELAPLLLSVQNNSVRAKRMFQAILSHTHKSGYVKEAHTGLGLALLMERDWEKSREHLSEALEVDPQYIPALVNRGVLYFLTGSFSLAQADFLQSLSYGSGEGVAALMLSRSILEVYANQEGKGIRDAEEIINAYLKTNFDYRQEAMLLKAYLRILAKKNDDVIITVDRLLDIDPDLTELHRHDPLIYDGVLGWEKLLPMCKTIQEHFGTNARTKGLLAYCLYRSNQPIAALSTLNTALAQSPEDPLLNAVSSFMSSKLNEPEKAQAALDVAGKSSQFRLPLILKIRRCLLDNDMACVVEKAQRLKQLDAKSLEAKHALAVVEIAKQNTQAAHQLINEGLRISRRYRPLLELKLKLDQ